MSGIWPGRLWSNKREKVFVNLVIQEMKMVFEEPFPESFSFSEESWENIRLQFNEALNVNYNVAELKWRFNGLKERYEVVAPLYEECCWDGKETWLFFYDEDWYRKVEDNPEIEPYRKHGCPLFIELAFIFGPRNPTRESDSCEGNDGIQPSNSMNIAPDSTKKQVRAKPPRSGRKKLTSQVVSDGIWPEKPWNKKLEKVFVKLVFEEMKKMFGRYPESFSFSNESWEKISQQFSEALNVSFDVPELKRHFDGMKKRYENVKKIYDGDCGWDGKRKMVFICDYDWKELIKETPEIEPYKKHGCPLYVELSSIFGPHRPWEYDSSDDEVDTQPSTDRNIAPFISRKKLRSEAPSSGLNKPPSRDMFEEIWPDHIWTNKREKSFVELVRTEMFLFSSSIPEKTIDQSWENIRQWFNESHSVQFDVPELKKRLASLKKRYECVETLHDSADFCWDHKRKIIDISYSDWNWEDIAEGTPELKYYPKYKCPLYNELSCIFTQETAGGFSTEVCEIDMKHPSGREFAAFQDMSKKRIKSEAPDFSPSKKNRVKADDFPTFENW